jgi:GNAT superfamily N-acetyltransferase
VAIRELDLRDGPTLAAWLDAHDAAFGVRWTPDDHRRAFDEHPVIRVLATSGAFDASGTLIGAASIATYRRAPSIGLTHYIFVRPEAQEHGVGALLLRHRYAALVQRGVEAIECQTHLHRRSSLHLHFAHGFVPKYRFEPFNSPDRTGRLARVVVNRRLRALYDEWRAGMGDATPDRS